MTVEAIEPIAVVTDYCGLVAALRRRIVELAAALRGSAATVIKTIVFCEWSVRAVLTKLAVAS
jgi:hypothetical protein